MNKLIQVVLIVLVILTWAYWSLAAAPIEMEVEARLGGKVIGLEKVALSPGPEKGGWTVGTEADFVIQGMQMKVETALEWVGPEAVAVRYDLSGSRAGSPQAVSMSREGDQVVFHASGSGIEVSETAVGTEPMVVLDNMVAGHYLHLLEKLKTAGDGPQTMRVAVPQVMKVLTMTVNGTEPEMGTFEGKTVPVSVHVLKVANLLTFVRSSDQVPGGFLELEVPMQTFSMVRKGFSRGALEEEPAVEEPVAEGLRTRDLEVPSDGIGLGATLTLPESRTGKVPGIVLVHGSGPNDRDETVAGVNKPFRDLAEGLSGMGIAVLRYDKRAYAMSGKFDVETLLDKSETLEQVVVDDAVAALNLLRAQEEVDPTRIFVLGHSLGGVALPWILEKAPWASGGIALAGAARPIDEMILEQTEYLLTVNEATREESEQKLAELEKIFQRVRSGEAADEEVIIGARVAFWRDVLQRDPAKEAAELPQPLLFLRGSKDYQVTAADQNLWMAAAAEAGKMNASFRTFPGLNHLFMKVEGASDGSDYQRAGHVDGEVVKTIANWIVSQPPAS